MAEMKEKCQQLARKIVLFQQENDYGLHVHDRNEENFHLFSNRRSLQI